MRAAARFRARYGPWALVAGGSDGIGAEFARRLASFGLNLVLVGRRIEALAEIAAELEERRSVVVRTLSLDLSERGGLELLLEETSGLEIGLVVSNAAVSVIGPFLEQAEEDHERLLSLNCEMPMRLAYEFGRRMSGAGRGGIILLSSMAAFQGTLLSAHYAASKAYVRVLAEGLWAELRPRGVDVIASCPGTVRTPTFLRDEPVSQPRATLPIMESGPIVTQTLAALGRRPFVVPGGFNRVVSFFMQRLLPRKILINLTARGTRAMYPHIAARVASPLDEERSAGGRH